MGQEFKTGFWCDEDMRRSMEQVRFRDLFGYQPLSSIENAWGFLHGGCLKFALVLHQMFGYEIRIAWDAPFADRTENIWEVPAIVDWDAPESFWEHLVHGYCAAEIGGRTAYIDVRGITTERPSFFGEFTERFHPCPYEEPRIPPALLEKFLRTDSQSEEEFRFARRLIKERDYTLPRSGL